MIDDYSIARRYMAKCERAADSNVDFQLSFNDFKRIVKSKYCRYTGIELTHQTKKHPEQTDVTIDRVDNSIGYTKENSVPCCHAYNVFKAAVENPNNVVSFKMIEKALRVQSKILNRNKCDL